MWLEVCTHLFLKTRIRSQSVSGSLLRERSRATPWTAKSLYFLWKIWGNFLAAVGKTAMIAHTSHPVACLTLTVFLKFSGSISGEKQQHGTFPSQDCGGKSGTVRRTPRGQGLCMPLERDFQFTCQSIKLKAAHLQALLTLLIYF